MIQPKFEPNALLLSVRNAPLRKRRSRHATRSCTRPPIVRLSVFVSPTANRADVPFSEPVPASSLAPNACVPRIISLLNRPLTFVVDLRLLNGLKSADSVAFAL